MLQRPNDTKIFICELDVAFSIPSPHPLSVENWGGWNLVALALFMNWIGIRTEQESRREPIISAIPVFSSETRKKL